MRRFVDRPGEGLLIGSSRWVIHGHRDGIRRPRSRINRDVPGDLAGVRIDGQTIWQPGGCIPQHITVNIRRRDEQRDGLTLIRNLVTDRIKNRINIDRVDNPGEPDARATTTTIIDRDRHRIRTGNRSRLGDRPRNLPGHRIDRQPIRQPRSTKRQHIVVGIRPNHRQQHNITLIADLVNNHIERRIRVGRRVTPSSEIVTHLDNSQRSVIDGNLTERPEPGSVAGRLIR